MRNFVSVSWGTPGKTTQCVTRAKPAQDWGTASAPAAAQRGIWGITCESPPYQDGVRIQRTRGPNQAGYQQNRKSTSFTKIKRTGAVQEALITAQNNLGHSGNNITHYLPWTFKRLLRQEQVMKIGKFPFFANSVKLLQLLQCSFCCFFHSFCWTVASRVGKALILCAKCIRQSSQMTAPIQLVNGLFLCCCISRWYIFCSQGLQVIGSGFFYNTCSMNTWRNLKEPTQQSLGKKTSLHLLQSMAMISPAEGSSHCQSATDWPFSKVSA